MSGAERPVVAVATVKAGAGGEFLGPDAGGHIAHGVERAHGVLSAGAKLMDSFAVRL